ncbi:porin [Acetobacter sp.]|uniref:porin n=1 Tax=Acetobacter sp. TaxID=440 RepID=UPI0039EB3A01
MITFVSRLSGSRKKRIFQYGSILSVCVATASFAAQEAKAAVTVNFGKNQFFTLGVGVRGQYLSEDPNAKPSNSSAASFNDLRIYMGAQFHKYVKATLNVERLRDGNWNVLDGILQVEPWKEFNVWMGRMLPGSDRSNLDGPYFLSTYAYPMVSQYPGAWAGRDDGVTVWGKLLKDRFRYVAGIYRGHNWVKGGSNYGEHPLFAGRMEYNFLDPEPSPAYYTASTYYGKADILAIGLAGQYEVDGVGSAQEKGDYKAWNIDGLFEKKIGKDAKYGVYTLEGAYYQYYTDGVKDITAGYGQRAPEYGNVGGINNGTAFLASTAYLIPYKLGWGRLQPLVRYQQFRFKKDLYGAGHPKTTQFDAGANYVLDGHNLRFTLDYVRYHAANTPVSHAFLLGMQLQY